MIRDLGNIEKCDLFISKIKKISFSYLVESVEILKMDNLNYIVYEYCNRGNLRSFIEKFGQNNSRLTEDV